MSAIEEEEEEKQGGGRDVGKLLGRGGPLVGECFTASEVEGRKALAEARLLVVGAGGLGCELLKDLVLVGFRRLEVVDCDTIDVSNLNRQFLFGKEDVGKPKAAIAAAKVAAGREGVKVVAHYCKVQEKPAEFWAQFSVVLLGLDNVEARRWVNSAIVQLAEVNANGELTNPLSVVPLIDGGTEGVKGHARVIVPRLTACFECSLDAFPPQRNYPLCTLANTPRIAEHCIQWASLLHWPAQRKGELLDTDRPSHIQWLFEVASQRAKQFGIPGVTYKLTQGVVKRIIPAVASTNALVAAACANEAFKYVTDSADCMDNYMMYNGAAGAYTHTFSYERKDDCPICGSQLQTLSLPSSATLHCLLDTLSTDVNFQLKKPSLRTASTHQLLYIQAPRSLELKTRENLSKPLSEFLGPTGGDIQYTDPSLATLNNIIRVIFLS